MRSYTSIILLSLVSISLPVDSRGLEAYSTENLSSHSSNEFLSVQTEQENDKSPHRGSGRREFFHTLHKLKTAL